MFFQDPYLNEITSRNHFNKNISFSRNCDIKTTYAKSITDASIWVMFSSKNSDTLEIAEHSLLNSHIIISLYGYHLRSTDLADKPISFDSESLCKQTANAVL